jgi:hypothetical protein
LQLDQLELFYSTYTDLSIALSIAGLPTDGEMQEYLLQLTSLLGAIENLAIDRYLITLQIEVRSNNINIATK